VSGYGAWLFYHALLKGNHAEAGWAMVVLFGGATLVPALLVALGNRFIKSERAIPYLARQSSPLSLQLKKREKLIRRMYFLKKHPSVVFLFCLMALVVSTAMATAPCWSPHPHNPQDAFLQLTGIVCFLAYTVALLFLTYGVIAKKWEPYMDTSIKNLEKNLADVKARSTSPANPLP
jgi:hypothetical protein